MPQQIQEHFSQRSSAIETAKDDLVAAFAASHGRQPTAREGIQTRQQATLATREDKHVRAFAPWSLFTDGLRRTRSPWLGDCGQRGVTS